VHAGKRNAAEKPDGERRPESVGPSGKGKAGAGAQERRASNDPAAVDVIRRADQE
jgi:hypothetical protein